MFINSVELHGKKIEVLNNSLDLSGKKINDISEIKGLEELVNLEVLILMGNQIGKIKGLEGLTNLVALNLNRNKIAKIKGLDTLTKLRYLGLSHNKIIKISGLDNLRNLEELALSYNKIMEIQGLENLFNLRRLNLRGNPLLTASRRIYKTDIENVRMFCKQKNGSEIEEDLMNEVKSLHSKRNTFRIGMYISIIIGIMLLFTPIGPYDLIVFGFFSFFLIQILMIENKLKEFQEILLTDPNVLMRDSIPPQSRQISTLQDNRNLNSHPIILKCNFCNDTGICTSCNGQGIIQGERRCEICAGTGRCMCQD